jgi:hypothetical protein
MKTVLFRLALIAFCSAQLAGMHGQSNLWALRTQDSTGFIPAERLELTAPSTAASWWQRTAHNHLFDFSDDDPERNLIVVDPVVQSFVGRVLPEGQDAVAREWWDNIRGARFQGRIDGRWHVGGELLERQGVADPLLGIWASQFRTPGWGRSKLGKNGGYTASDQAYFDVMLTRGWVGTRQGAWSWDVGVDALHIGAGRSSAFLSRTAVPAPYARLTHAEGAHRTSLWSTRWISTRRGPTGETAESLLERTRAVFLTHQQFVGTHLVLQGVYNFSWETAPLIAEGGWESLGYEEGQTYRPTRHVAGLDIQFHQHVATTVHLTAYAQQSISWLVSTQSLTPLTRVAGILARGTSWSVRAEWAERDPSHCRDCHTIADGSFGPIQSEVTNSGLSVHGLWEESLRSEVAVDMGTRWTLSASAGTNERATYWQSHVHYMLQPTWPLRLWAGYGGVVPELDAAGAAFPAYRQFHLGLHAGIMNWR